MRIGVTPDVTPTGVTLVGERTHAVSVSRSQGAWVANVADVPDGQYAVLVDTSEGATIRLPDEVFLPDDDRLVVSARGLARRLGIPPSPDGIEMVTDAILDAQADVEAYLGRPLLPQVYSETGLNDVGEEWVLTACGMEDVRSIIAVRPEANGYTFRVTYLAGLDARYDPTLGPIRRYVRAHAQNQPSVLDLWRRTTNPAKIIRSSSTQGQSVSYEQATLGGGGAVGSGAPGSLPAITSLDRWRLAGRRVYQARSRVTGAY